MAAWAGFSDEELQRMQQKGEPSESVTASLGRGRRSATTNRSRQQLQREKALQMAAKTKAALSESPLSPEQQLQPAPPQASSPCQTNPEAVPKQDLPQEDQDPVHLDSTDPAVAVKELEKQEVELKRLEKAEAEYVAAKLDLHKKTEIKEQLTEHLCAIIQQNELRKAHKMEELMLQLELSAVQEEACVGREGPAHTATDNQIQEKLEMDCKDVSTERGETVARTNECQETKLLTAATGLVSHPANEQ